MFDLDWQVAQWRREIEATLAFSQAELDELEDHLRSAHESRLKKGDTPETAWTHARVNLGTASALALEFAKDKLLPALGRLLLAWWKPMVLLAVFSGALIFFSKLEDDPANPRTPALALIALAAMVTTFLFLPTRSERVALLAGLGSAVCLLVLLHDSIDAAVLGHFIDYGWNGGAYRPLLLPLAALGLVAIITWALRCWNGNERTLAIVGALVFLLGLVPLCDHLFGDITFRELYQLPAPGSATYRGDELVRFNNWYFVGTLFRAIVLLSTLLPLAIMLIGAVLAAGLGWRRKSIPIDQRASFPSSRDLPWCIALAAGGCFWVLSHILDPAMDDRYHDLQKSIAYQGHPHGGLEVMVLCYATLFLVCAVELTHRLLRAPRVLLFYASLVVAIQLLVIIGLIGLPWFFRETQYDPTHINISFEPAWLSVMLCGAVFVLATIQARHIRRAARSGESEVSLWKFDGAGLVRFGLGAGLVIACAGTMILSSSLVLAQVSVVYISALLDWGAAFRNPAIGSFHPDHYLGQSPPFVTALAGPGFLTLCLVIGLLAAIILSALEFIRFNAFRLYRLRKIKAHEPVVALNE